MRQIWRSATVVGASTVIIAGMAAAAAAGTVDGKKTDAMAALRATAPAATTVCGSGYELDTVIPLPIGTDPNLRLAALFNYTKGGNDFGCSILDNNTGTSKNKTKVSVCGLSGACQTDQGNYLEYAGPVYTAEPVCATVNAVMWNSAGTKLFDYRTEYAYLCD